jgi:hypothetical protein
LTKRRGAKQLGVPKIREAGKYFLTCRSIDLTDGCGSILYARENGSRRLYFCGRYMKSSDIECENNTIDAEAILKVTVETLVQKLQFGGGESKLKERLAALADMKSSTVDTDAVGFEMQQLESRRVDLERSLKTVERRMSMEEDDDRYKVIAATFDQLKGSCRMFKTSWRFFALRRMRRPRRTKTRISLSTCIGGSNGS